MHGGHCYTTFYEQTDLICVVLGWLAVYCVGLLAVGLTWVVFWGDRPTRRKRKARMC